MLRDNPPNPADEDEDDWQDVEVSEEWGPQTPMTPLNDDTDDMLCSSRQQVIDQRYPVVGFTYTDFHFALHTYYLFFTSTFVSN